LRTHSGWAVLIAIAGPLSSPSIVERRRIELADSRIPGSVQPYHSIEKLPLPQAEKFLNRCVEATRSLARRALKETVEILRQGGYRVARSCVLMSSARPAGALAAILASHALIHAAEGDFYRDALKDASEQCGIPPMGVRERDLLVHASLELGISVERIQQSLAELGRSLGPPWRRDEKLAAVAGWLALSGKP
jgi:hypothetical protein